MCEKGKKFGRLNKLQSRVAVLAFAIPALSVNLEAPECPERLGLPLDFVCRDRGKVIMRSDWSENAMWFTLDARPDGFLIGHDVCSRGTFVMNADGRSWGFCPEWKHFYESTDYSLPCIDGAGQLHKAPFVKLLDVFHGSCNSTFASADITYAYNWTWTTWAKEGEDYSKKGYEIEPNDPRDFGYNVWWAPNKLYGERNVAFVGLYQWRKRIATVERVMRSAMLVRASRPYVIISDRLKKDNEEHEYSWAMTTPDDVVLLSFDGRDAILTETEGNGRRFMIRSIGEIKGNLDCSFRVVDKLDEKADRDEKARQVVFKCKATAVNFIFVLYSLPYETSEAPVTTWNIKSQLLEVFQPETGETQRISFTEGDRGESVMKVIVEPDHICPNTSTSPYDFQTALI